MKRQTLLSWSSGKDSAWALHVLRQERDVEVVGLVTTINRAFRRVAMHGVHTTWLERQAAAANLPLDILSLPHPCSNAEYAAIMVQFLRRARALGVDAMAFGDLFLTEVRTYREDRLQGTGIVPLFPLWGKTTSELAAGMLAGGLRAIVTCIDAARLPRRLAGRAYDATLLAELPAGIDPCGENGEFHTFVTAGPMFQYDIAATAGAVVERDGFVFADLVPATPPA